jgi:sec-independent protein translocase protein TatA
MGATEIIFIFLVYLLLFGAKGIPSFARTMGGAVREFRNATDQIQREILSSTDGIKEEVNKVRNAADAADPFNSPPARPKPQESKPSEAPTTEEIPHKPNS